MAEPINSEAPGIEVYIRVIRRRLPLILLVAAVAGILMFLLTRNRADVFQAEADVLVLERVDINGTSARVNIENEQGVMTSVTTAQGAAERLGDNPDTAGDLLRDLEVTFRENADILFLRASSTDPERARDVVNAFAEEYVENRTSSIREPLIQQVVVLEGDLERLDQESLDARERLQQLTDEQALRIAAIPQPDPDDQASIAEFQAAAQSIRDELAPSIRVEETNISRVDRQIDTEETELSNARSTLSSLTARAEVLTFASTPVTPSGTPSWILTAAAVIVGTFFGLVLALVLERLDTSARGRTAIEAALQTSVLAAVPAVPVQRGKPSTGLVMIRQGSGRRVNDAVEAFRRIRTQVRFATQASGTRALLVTSPNQGDGKSLVAANLALALSQVGIRVAVVSANLRRPMLERYLGVDEPMYGLSSWLDRTPTRKALEAGEATADSNGNKGGDLLVAVSPAGAEIENLALVPCGPRPENPTELLSSPQFGALVRHLESHFDLVLIDAPDFLNTADASTMLEHLGGVLVVVDGRNSSIPELERLRQEIDQVGGDLVGAVVNFENADSGRRGFGR